MASDSLDLRVEVENLNRSRSTAIIRADKAFAAQVEGRTRPYKNLPVMFKPALEETAKYVRTTMIPRIFEREGPGWSNLAPRTVAERIAAGYSGSHPILQRSGDMLASLTERSHPEHVEIIKVGKNSRIEIGSRSKKFRDNQLGNLHTRLPARPMLPGTGSNQISMTDKIAIEGFFKRVKERNRDARI